MPKEGVTYRQVEEICDQLQADNRRISTRAILAETGGSMSTVLKHFRKWMDKQAAKGRELEGFSDVFRKALSAEISRHVAASREQDKDLIADLRRQVDEAAGMLEETELNLEMAEGNISGMDEQNRELEKKLAVTQERLTDAKAEIEDTRALLMAAEQQKAEAEKSLAVLEARLLEMEKRL